MSSRARVWVLMVFCGLVLAVALPAAAGAAEFPVIEKLVATNCVVSTCGQEDVLGPFFEPKASISKAEAEAEGETQAGGRVPFGVTDFKVLTPKEIENEKKEKVAASYATGTVEPTAIVEHLRTDVAPGLATNPFAVEMCTTAEFGEAEVVPGTGFYPAVNPLCKKAEIGTQSATVFAGIPEQPGFEKQKGGGDIPLSGKVYDLVPQNEKEEADGQKLQMANGAKLAALYAVALELPKPLTEKILNEIFKGSQKAIEEGQYYAHTLILGNVEWGTEARGTSAGDYHDYFEIHVSPALPLVRSRLVFDGNIGKGDFITNATACPGHLTTSLHMTDKEGAEAPVKQFTTPIGLTGCSALEFPINFGFHPSTTTTDSPNEFTAEASIEHNPKAHDVSQVKQAKFVLPAGMTLNPSAANGLAGCKPSQAHEIAGTEKFTEEFGVGCPAASQIGTVSLNVPTLPDGSLTGAAYLGQPEGGPITAPPFTMYVVANSAQYGISVRLIAHVSPDLATGQVTTTFSSPPEQPFTNLAITFNRNVLAPIANPLLCGEAKGVAVFEPTSAPGSLTVDQFGQTITGCNSSPAPFKPTQKTSNSNGNAGASTNFTFNLARNDGEMYVGSVKTQLPPGLVGKIAIAERCQEAAANSETAACPATSQIGTATVLAGSGSQPFSFSGPVYLTGPYQGSPYGMSIKVPAVAGPFNFGTVVTRAGITVNPYTSQVIVESTLPRIRQGVPLRIKNISITVNKSGFMINPTNCGAFKTVSTVGGFSTLEPGGATGSALAESPFQVANCNALKFAPKFKASSNAKTSRTNGASLITEVTQSAGQANIKYVKVQLPRSLPSRLTTLQKACPEQVFNVNPLRCGSGAFVGGAVVHTPTLPQPLRGPAILVSHANAAFPDLDLVVEDPNHLRVILVGNTNIKNNITTTTFASTPDVPVSSVRVELPIGSHSALAAYGNICAKSLVMPTTMTAQNGKSFKQNTIINVAGCPVEIVGRKVVGNFVYITARVPAAGRVSVSGINLRTTTKKAKRAYQNVTLKVPLTSAGKGKKPLTVHVRVGFVPKKGKHSVATTKVSFH